MDAGRRILLVARRYWPHCDDASQRLCAMAEGLARLECQPTILTMRDDARWTERMRHREIQVERPLETPRSYWSSSRYVRALQRWIVQHAASFDVFYCDAMREEAAAVVGAGSETGVPTVLRYGGMGH